MMDAATGYSQGLNIPRALLIRCMGLLQDCDECAHPQKLKTFARFYSLELVMVCIESSDKIDWLDFMVKLLTKGRSPLQPPLFELLDALLLQYEKEEARCNKFKELKEEVKGALVEAAKTDRDYQQLVEVLAPRVGHGAGESARAWVEEAGDDLDELSLRITLAVFHGTAFEFIERAKDDLRDSLQQLVPPPPPPKQDEPPPPPHVPLMRRLEKAGARESDGKPPDWKRAVELEQPGLAAEALWYVWQLYRESSWRQKLVEWLTRYVTGQSADVRTRAAVAAGRLAVKDYRFVRDRLLLHWVEATEEDNRRDVPPVFNQSEKRSDESEESVEPEMKPVESDEKDNRRSAQYRMAVGMALGLLVREKEMAAEVQGLLRKWTKSKNRAERWAAARAYIYVGAYCRPASEVIRSWREIAAPELAAVDIQITEHLVLRLKNPMYMSLVDAMIQFFASVAQQPAEDKRPLVEGILEGLKDWIAKDEDDPGLGLFMFNMLGRMMSLSAVENGEADNPPLLLQLVDEQPIQTEYRARLAGLFDLAMRNGATIIDAKELLCSWLGWVNGLQDNSGPYETRVRTLLQDIIAADTSGRMRGRLAACLRDCGRNHAVERVLSGL